MGQMINRSSRNHKNDYDFLGKITDFYARMVNGEDVRTEEEKMIDTIKQAHEEWKNAEVFFQNVTEPDLIDHAIYRAQAAKTRYAYLMKLAREMGARGNIQ